MKSLQRAWITSVMASLLLCGAALALGLETIGNQPLSDANYTEWPGIMPVVNHPSRVYHQWVNGNEFFFFSGDTGSLNDALQKFSGTKSGNLEVVLRPGPGEARTFAADRTIAYQWQLHLIGGVARYLTSRDRGQNVWPDHPVLTISVSEAIDLNKLEIPAGLKVISFTDVKTRTRAGLQSKDQTVRGWTAGELASLDPYDEVSRDAITAMLTDEVPWVRLNAVHALASFGKKAESLLPTLRAIQTEDATLSKARDETISQIERAENPEVREKKHRELTNQIQRFLVGRRK